jgi:hypothetical protein
MGRFFGFVGRLGHAIVLEVKYLEAKKGQLNDDALLRIKSEISTMV